MLRLATIAVAAVSLVGGPPSSLFHEGYNLCRAAPLSAIRAAGGQPYRAGLFANKSCLWERADLKAGVTLSTHPRPAGLTLMRQFRAMDGKGGFVAKPIHVPGASSGVLVTLPHSLSKTVARYLFAAYPRGVVQVNMNAPRSLPATRLLAVLRAVT